MKTARSKNILLTGKPRCGKSTLIERIVRQSSMPMTGFFTREIREAGRRLGFRIVTLDGKEGILAHVKIDSPIRLGKYRVNLGDLDGIAVPAMIPMIPEQIVVIDEIGKMECCSNRFRTTLEQTLDSPNRVIASIALKGDAFIRKIKGRSDVALILVSEQNRDTLADCLPAICFNQ